MVFSPVLLKLAVLLSLLILPLQVLGNQEGSVGFGGEYHMARHYSLYENRSNLNHINLSGGKKNKNLFGYIIFKGQPWGV